MEKKYLNGLCTVLSLFTEDDVVNGYDNFANYMLDKINKYGRKFVNKNGKEKIALYLYNNEAELLIQMMAISLTATIGVKEDYYEQVGKNSYDKNDDRHAIREQKLNEIFS